MPKGLNLKTFGRRKSSGNALDFEQEAPAAPAQSSFRVLERPDKKTVTYGSRDSPVGRPFISPLHALRGKSVDDLGLAQKNPSIDASRNRPGWPLSGARGSGGTTNSGSSGYYESSSASARHSSTSTLPSSLDQDHHQDEEELYPAKRAQTTGMYQSVGPSADEPLPPPPRSFTNRAARALSFGQKGKTPKELPQDVPPLPPPHSGNGALANPTRSHSPFRDRAMTTSSYASTAVPLKTELTLDGDFGKDDDFSNMFDDMKKRDHPLPPPPTVGSFHRTVRVSPHKLQPRFVC